MASAPSPGWWMEAGYEAGLVLSAQQGHVDSYLELMEHYCRPLYRLAFALTRDRELARLMTQDALIQAWKTLRHFPVGQPFPPWLLRNVRNLAIAQRRRGLTETPAAGAGARSRAAVFRAAFADLGVDDQLVLALSAVEGLPYAALAAALDVKPHTALSKLSAARDRLRNGVAARQGGDG